jgi:hypothetical protein
MAKRTDQPSSFTELCDRMLTYGVYTRYETGVLHSVRMSTRLCCRGGNDTDHHQHARCQPSPVATALVICPIKPPVAFSIPHTPSIPHCLKLKPQNQCQ